MRRLSEEDFIVPDWPAPGNVRALQTTRAGGVSRSPYDSLNLAMHVGDDPLDVARNRQRLSPHLPSEPLWLNQTHGTTVVDVARAGCSADADAAFATQRHAVCAVMTADCLPVLFCDRRGTVVAAAHAGWRGLCDGILEATVAALPVPPSALLAWLGPAIGPQAFGVGEEVRAAFVARQPEAARAFIATGDGWLADLYELARLRLQRIGVTDVYGGGHPPFCTSSDAARFFSFRRDGATGRMATLIWFE